jgi:RNA polymerase sigma factor (sigma-70 family)
MLGDQASAEDAVHIVFRNILRTMPGYPKPLSRAYLFVSLRRVCTRLAHQSRCWTVLDVITNTPGSDESLLPADNVRRLRVAIDQLPTRCRQVLEMQIEGYSYQEIGQMLGVAPNTVNAYIQKARCKLRATLCVESGRP